MMEQNTYEVEYNGVKYNVLKYLPRKEKERVAYDIVANSLYIDDDTGIVVDAPYADVAMRMILLREYTDYDVPEDQEEQIKLYDEQESFSGSKDFEFAVFTDDVFAVISMATNIASDFKKIQERKSSLSHKLDKMFGSLLEDESIDESLMKASGINEFLIDLMKKAQGNEGAEVTELNIKKKNLN